MDSFVYFLPANTPGWLLLTVSVIVIVVLWKVLRRILSVIWAIRAIIALVSFLGLGGYFNGWFSTNFAGAPAPQASPAAHR